MSRNVPDACRQSRTNDIKLPSGNNRFRPYGKPSARLAKELSSLDLYTLYHGVNTKSTLFCKKFEFFIISGVVKTPIHPTNAAKVPADSSTHYSNFQPHISYRSSPRFSPFYSLSKHHQAPKSPLLPLPNKNPNFPHFY